MHPCVERTMSINVAIDYCVEVVSQISPIPLVGYQHIMAHIRYSLANEKVENFAAKYFLSMLRNLIPVIFNQWGKTSSTYFPVASVQMKTVICVSKHVSTLQCLIWHWLVCLHSWNRSQGSFAGVTTSFGEVLRDDWLESHYSVTTDSLA